MKPTKKTFFLIPGFKMQIKNKTFDWVVTFLEGRGVRVIKTPVQWKLQHIIAKYGTIHSIF